MNASISRTIISRDKEMVSSSPRLRLWLTSRSQEENSWVFGSFVKHMFCFGLEASTQSQAADRDRRSEAKTMSALEPLRTTGRICWKSPSKTTVIRLFRDGQ